MNPVSVSSSASSSVLALTSPLLTQAGFCHGFFTRQGGVSRAPFASLNTSASTGDQREHVEENWSRIANTLQVAPRQLFFLRQTHGIAHRYVGANDFRDDVAENEGDVILATDPHVAVAVRTADCVPILLADRRTGAACAVHAGWRGVFQNAPYAGVQALRAQTGHHGDLVAAVGPHISVNAFEIDDTTAAQLAALAPKLSVVVRRTSARPHVDLRALVHEQLRQAGVGAIDDVPGCTVAEPERFFSFRRDGDRSGRMISAIVPRPS